MNILIIFRLCLQFSIIQYLSAAAESLKFVQVWFRHGQRMPTHYLQFPNEHTSDYLNIAYPGELTNEGIWQEFKLGEQLRTLYGSHFGDNYKPSEFHVYTGVDNRTSTSAQAMFSGFFPPTLDQTWSSTIKWIPVAQHTDPPVDWLSTGIRDHCPVYSEYLENSKPYLDAMRNIIETDKELWELCQNHTGLELNNPVEYNHVIDSLKTRLLLKDVRLPYPKWAKGYEERVRLISFLIHDEMITVQNDTVGYYHIDTVMSYIEDHLSRPLTKGVFISGHDTNLWAIMKAFQLIDHQQDLPQYGSHLAIELHQINEQLHVKFLYSDGFDKPQRPLTPQFCSGDVCTLDQLSNITINWRKTKIDWWNECKGIGIIETASSVTASMIIVLAVLLLSTIILGFTTFSYKRQINNMKDPERVRLLN